MVGFIGDCTGKCNDFQPQTQADTSTIASWMQHDAQTWNDLLWCLVGKLELPKCSFHTLQFTFLPNGMPKMALVPISSQIQVTNAATGQVIQIPSTRADDPHKPLGHWKAPAGHLQKHQLAALTTKANSIITLIFFSQLTRFGSTLAYHGIYLPSMKYILPKCFSKTRPLIWLKESRYPH
jgi:hypothetical protein